MKRVLLATALVLASTQSFAADFTAADNLYSHRKDSAQAIKDARLAYKNMVPSLSGADLVYAVEQMVRLDSYEGSLIGAAGPTQPRLTIYSRCMDTLDLIDPETVGETPQYYYWKASCLALWAQANGILSSLFRSGELFEYLDAGEAIDPTYEGGGFWRVKGAVYAKLPPINLFGPTRDLDESKRLLELSINAPAYTHSRNPSTDTGNYFYGVFQYYAETLDALGEREEAIGVLEDAIANYEAGVVAPDRDIETKISVDDIRTLLTTLQND